MGEEEYSKTEGNRLKVNVHEKFAQKYITGTGIMPRRDIKYPHLVSLVAWPP